MQEDESYIKYEDLEGGKSQSWRDRLADFLNSRYFVVAVVILVAIIAFALGRISGLGENREPVKVLNTGEVKGVSVDTSPPNPSPRLGEGGSALSDTSGKVVASKSGTKYHYPWCAGAKQISAKNLITFDSIEAARAAGYSPASNCKGLK